MSIRLGWRIDAMEKRVERLEERALEAAFLLESADKRLRALEAREEKRGRPRVPTMKDDAA